MACTYAIVNNTTMKQVKGQVKLISFTCGIQLISTVLFIIMVFFYDRLEHMFNKKLGLYKNIMHMSIASIFLQTLTTLYCVGFHNVSVKTLKKSLKDLNFISLLLIYGLFVASSVCWLVTLSLIGQEFISTSTSQTANIIIAVMLVLWFVWWMVLCIYNRFMEEKTPIIINSSEYTDT